MKVPSTFLRGAAVACVIWAVMRACALGMFASPEPTPLDRLLKSADAFVEKHPDRAEGRYTLGRIHYLAFHLKTDQIPAFRHREGEDEPPYLAPQWMLGWTSKESPAKPLNPSEFVDHAAKALQNFKEAIRLKNMKEPGLVLLGVASLEEEFADWNENAKVADLPPDLKGITPAKIRADYARAMNVALEKDSKLTNLPVEGLQGITGYEAANGLIRLGTKAGDSLSAEEKKSVAQAKIAIARFKSLRMGPITPVVFSFRPAERLDELLAPGTVVDFDLRGYGPRQQWPWIRPELGLLVWNPSRNGVIESARQLFGGYTFEIFRANGYDALVALDDNGDGVLSGAELEGISVWFDRNSDGVSAPDEVIPVRDLGVVSIAVSFEGYDGRHPTNSRGIQMEDGSTLRTWDWIVAPLNETQTPPLASSLGGHTSPFVAAP